MNININTVEYWDERFKSVGGKADWELCNGCQQSENFMKAMIINLPEKNIDQIKKSHILDFGCALGDGTNYLKTTFPKSKITGYDFSLNAVNIAKIKYPEIYFSNVLIATEIFDYVLLNNVLQCVDDVELFLKDIAMLTKKCFVIMVPFGNNGTTIEHFNKFQLKSFPKEIENFYRRKMMVINADSWCFKQILVRYERIE